MKSHLLNKWFVIEDPAQWSNSRYGQVIIEMAGLFLCEMSNADRITYTARAMTGWKWYDNEENAKQHIKFLNKSLLAVRA